MLYSLAFRLLIQRNKSVGVEINFTFLNLGLEKSSLCSWQVCYVLAFFFMKEEFDLLRSKLFVSLLLKNNSTSLLIPPATQAGKLNKMESTEKIKARWFPLTVIKG